MIYIYLFVSYKLVNMVRGSFLGKTCLFIGLKNRNELYRITI